MNELLPLLSLGETEMGFTVHSAFSAYAQVLRWVFCSILGRSCYYITIESKGIQSTLWARSPLSFSSNI